jgi:hypothetical protein
MRLNCFIEQDLAGNGFTNVVISCYFFNRQFKNEMQRLEIFA